MIEYTSDLKRIGRQMGDICPSWARLVSITVYRVDMRETEMVTLISLLKVGSISDGLDSNAKVGKVGL